MLAVLALAPDMSAEHRPGDASGIARKASIEKFRDLSLLTELDAKIKILNQVHVTKCLSRGAEFRGFYSKFIHGDNREEKASVGGGHSYSREA